MVQTTHHHIAHFLGAAGCISSVLRMTWSCPRSSVLDTPVPVSGAPGLAADRDLGPWAMNVLLGLCSSTKSLLIALANRLAFGNKVAASICPTLAVRKVY